MVLGFFYDAKLNKIVNLSFYKSQETGGLSGVSWKLGLNLRRTSLSTESKWAGKKLSQNSMKEQPGRIISKMKFYLCFLCSTKHLFCCIFPRKSSAHSWLVCLQHLMEFSLHQLRRDGASYTHFTVAELSVWQVKQNNNVTFFAAKNLWNVERI